MRVMYEEEDTYDIGTCSTPVYEEEDTCVSCMRRRIHMISVHAAHLCMRRRIHACHV
jgi:hypothetical protein